MLRRRAIVVAALALLPLFPAAGLATADSDAGKRPKPRPLCLGKRATIVGTARQNMITGTRRADVIAALGGADTAGGGAGNDRVCGGAGDDLLTGGTGTDRLDGGPGFDTCRGGERLAACEETRPAPRVGPLAAGEYVTDVFRPRFSFAVGTGWQLPFREAFRQVLLLRRPDPGGLAIGFDSSNEQGVADTLARLTSIPGTTVIASPTAASVGGSSGQRLEILTVAGDIVAITGFSERYELEPGDRARLYVVEARGRTVTVVIEAPAAEFDAYAVVAEEVLGSLRFG